VNLLEQLLTAVLKKFLRVKNENNVYGHAGLLTNTGKCCHAGQRMQIVGISPCCRLMLAYNGGCGDKCSSPMTPR